MSKKNDFSIDDAELFDMLNNYSKEINDDIDLIISKLKEDKE